MSLSSTVLAFSAPPHVLVSGTGELIDLAQVPGLCWLLLAGQLLRDCVGTAACVSLTADCPGLFGALAQCACHLTLGCSVAMAVAVIAGLRCFIKTVLHTAAVLQ